MNQTVGASRNRGALPTGHTTDTVTIGGQNIEITICDVANIILFVRAGDMGISGSETAETISADKNLIARCKELRGKAAQLVAMCDDWEKVDEEAPGLPMVCMVAPPESSKGDLNARILLNNSCHDSMAGSGAICIAACSRIPGSIVSRSMGASALEKKVLHVIHPLGVMPVWVEKAWPESKSDATAHIFNTLSFVRTSRRIMEGVAYVPNEIWDGKINTKVQTNGHTDGAIIDDLRVARVDAMTPVTKLLAEFAAMTTFDVVPTAVVDKMKTFVLDYIGNASYGAKNSESSDPIYRAISAFSGGSTGNSTVLTKGQKFQTHYAAQLNATFAHSLDFDDTFQAGSLHPGVTCISAALAQAEVSRANGTQFLTAVAVGYEVVCRIGRALGPGAYERGFHNTSTAGIFGAVAAAAKIKSLDAQTTEMAFGIAGSQAAGSMQYLATGAWNKRLHPGLATHNGLLSIALAEAGVHGAVAPIEGKYGLLNGYSTTSSTVGLTDGLGKEWCSTETSIKPYPGCRATHGAIDLAAKMRKTPPRGVERLTLAISTHIYDIVGAPLPSKIHPKNVVDAQFSAYYQLAVTWLDGNTSGLAVYDRMFDADVHDLSDRIVVEADEKLSGLATRLTVQWGDETESTEMVTKTKVTGESANPMTMDKVVEKFMSLAGPVYGAEIARGIAGLVDQLEDCDSLRELMARVA